MKNTCHLLLLCISSMLAGCSINVAQSSVIVPSPQIFNTPIPSGNVNQAAITSTPLYPVTYIPITWADLQLTGKLVYISATEGSNDPILGINILNLVSGEIDQIFTGPDISWIYYMSVSPDNRQLIMAYSSPPQNHDPISQELYTLPLDGSQPPQLFVAPPTQYDQYIQAEWSPDGKYIYYVHNNNQNQPIGQYYPIYEIYRMAYPNGQPEKIADQAFWPRLSEDGSRLVYISMDPTTGTNSIFMANADGSNAQRINITGDWIPDIIDAPIFSPDGESIIFSALSPQQSSAPSWFDKLMGVQIAEAHSIPSDWFSVPLAGGDATRLTNLRTISLYASIAPDKRYIASYSGNGLFVMKPDGTDLTMLIPDMGGVPGMVSWIP
jgi:Tol biopolymer transport system component